MSRNKKQAWIWILYKTANAFNFIKWMNNRIVALLIDINGDHGHYHDQWRPIALLSSDVCDSESWYYVNTSCHKNHANHFEACHVWIGSITEWNRISINSMSTSFGESLSCSSFTVHCLRSHYSMAFSLCFIEFLFMYIL